MLLLITGNDIESDLPFKFFYIRFFFNSQHEIVLMPSFVFKQKISEDINLAKKVLTGAIRTLIY